ncbi:hypothetical protein [Corallococcus sp. CA047B]|uniref:hypothetical protein n=1 Tax=Corallococcus sp. CA047B TaxID=2316729 RepID=UPI0013151AEB|nr:hypothetical protein [Corallococcus sp. CA047B]
MGRDRAVFGLVPFRYTQEDTTALMERLQALARKQGAVVAAELVRASGKEQLPLHLANRDAWLGPERLLIHFASAEDAARVARSLNGAFCVAGTEVLVEADHIGSRLQRLFEMRVTPLTGRHVIVEATYRGTELQPPELGSRLRPYLKPEDRLTASDSPWGIRLRVRTTEPLRVLPAVVELGTLVGAEARVQMHDEDRLAAALHRIRVELESELRGR